MAATVSRSTRRTENHHHNPQVLANARRNVMSYGSNSTRTKRNLESTEVDFDAFRSKKPRFAGITVEIPARPSPQPKIATDCDAKPDHARPAVAAALVPPKPLHPPSSTTEKSRTAETQQRPNGSLKHQHKEANTLKNELSSLQSSLGAAKEPGRKLRSQEATRFKSELSAYFPDYDEVIGNDPKENHLLNLDTAIIITDSHPGYGKKSIRAGPKSSSDATGSHQPHSQLTTAVRSYSDTLFTDLFDSQRIDFSFLLETRNKGKTLEDPLPDSLFIPAHKKAERLEKSIRNTEKGRAQHEKDQIIRLLDGLQGHDWLRIMGVSGITETKKKTFEPARDHFIRGCQSILEKFRSWAAEEKRRKLEKAHAEAEAAHEDEDEDEEEEEEEEEVNQISDDDGRESEDDGVDKSSGAGHDEPRYSSDVDASIAKQLQEEALAAAKKRARATRVGRRVPLPPPPPEPEPYKTFTSFFDKKYQRDAALSTNRRKGRSVMAWGHPVPDLEERDFELPEEYRDEDTLKAHARRKRREKRHHD